jgi:hypothetical protein
MKKQQLKIKINGRDISFQFPFFSITGEIGSLSSTANPCGGNCLPIACWKGLIACGLVVPLHAPISETADPANFNLREFFILSFNDLIRKTLRLLIHISKQESTNLSRQPFRSHSRRLLTVVQLNHFCELS